MLCWLGFQKLASINECWYKMPLKFCLEIGQGIILLQYTGSLSDSVLIRPCMDCLTPHYLTDLLWKLVPLTVENFLTIPKRMCLG